MTRRQSNNQWSGGIEAKPASPQKVPSVNIRWKISRLEFLGSRRHTPHWLFSKGPNYQDWVLLISAGAIGGHFEEKMPKLRECHKGVFLLPDNGPASPGTCNPEETGLPGLPVSWSSTLFSESGPVGLPPVPWTEKNNWKVAIFVRWTGHSCCEDLIVLTNLWFFWVACKS